MADIRQEKADFITRTHVVICMIWTAQFFAVFARAMVIFLHDEQYWNTQGSKSIVASIIALLMGSVACFLISRMVFCWCRIVNVALWLSIVLKKDFDIKDVGKCIKTGRWIDERIAVSDCSVYWPCRLILYAGLVLAFFLLTLNLSELIVNLFLIIEACAAIFVLYAGLSLLYRTLVK